MRLKKYLSELSSAGRDAFANACETTRGHLQNVAYGYRTASPNLSSAIERATHGVVTRKDLRPNDWQEIWPELAQPSAPNKAVDHG